jgi:hypothetical protein
MTLSITAKHQPFRSIRPHQASPEPMHYLTRRIGNAAPTRQECPEILSHSCLSNPIHRPIFRSTAITTRAVSDSPPVLPVITRVKTGPDWSSDPWSHSLINRIDRTRNKSGGAAASLSECRNKQNIQ